MSKPGLESSDRFLTERFTKEGTEKIIHQLQAEINILNEKIAEAVAAGRLNQVELFSSKVRDLGLQIAELQTKPNIDLDQLNAIEADELNKRQFMN